MNVKAKFGIVAAMLSAGIAVAVGGVFRDGFGFGRGRENTLIGLAILIGILQADARNLRR
ncbi:MAG: hypothetical protein HRF49_03070 [bacterium]|jgi:hypothetical protein